VERQGDQHLFRGIRDEQAGYAAANRQKHALYEPLRNEPRSRSPQCEANRGLRAPRHASREKQVRHICTGDEQHQTAHRQQNLETAPIILAHLLHAIAGRYHSYVLLR